MKSARRVVVFGFFASLGLLVFRAGAPRPSLGASDPPSYTVMIKDFGFSPQTLEIPAGARVTWINQDDEPHTVRDTKNAFASPALDTKDKFTFEFKTSGSFNYYCTVHPQMTGKVMVKN